MKNKVTPFQLSNIHLLKGPFKERQDAHRKYLLMVEPDRLLAPFREQAGLPPKAERYGGWEKKQIAGHSLGHYLSAVSLMYAVSADDKFHDRAVYIVDELGECQQANGNGYVFPLPVKLFEDIKEGILSRMASL